MEWNGKEISQLTDDDLALAANQIGKMETNYNAKRNDPKYAERFKNQSFPEPNEKFIQLKTEINDELNKRKK